MLSDKKPIAAHIVQTIKDSGLSINSKHQLTCTYCNQVGGTCVIMHAANCNVYKSGESFLTTSGIVNHSSGQCGHLKPRTVAVYDPKTRRYYHNYEYMNIPTNAPNFIRDDDLLKCIYDAFDIKIVNSDGDVVGVDNVGNVTDIH